MHLKHMYIYLRIVYIYLKTKVLISQFILFRSISYQNFKKF